MSIYKNKNKYWISIYFSGKRFRKPSPENTYAGAKAYESLLMQKLARGEPLVAEHKKLEATPTFREFTKKWFDVYVKTNNKYSEILNKESVLRAHLNPCFGDKLLDKISSLDIESYKAKKLQSGQANKSVNNHLIILSKCLKMAQEWGVMENIPKIKLLKVQPQKFDFLSTEECQSLLDNCDGLLKEMVLVGLKTGLRFGELIALEWSDVDLKSNLMTVQKSISRGRLGSTKSNKIRYVPLLGDISEMLEIRSKKRGVIFGRNDNIPLNPMLCLRWLHQACKKAGMRRIGWHTLRHTFASHLAQSGVSIVLIKELLGHADIKTTMRYSHLTSQAIRGAIEALGVNFSHHLVTAPIIHDQNILLSDALETKILQKTQ